MAITEKSPAQPVALRIPDPQRRNKFFYGKLMDAYHFELETKYLNAKRWLLNGFVSGTGVVCGLDVKEGKQDNEIIITAGLAIDKWGREIMVPVPTPSIPIPAKLIQEAATRGKSNPDDCFVHVLISYKESEGEPTPVFASQCGGDPPCSAGAIIEGYSVEFMAGSVPQTKTDCAFPEAASPGVIDYPALATWVTRKKRCLTFSSDPRIPLANIPVAKGGERCHCGPEHIDIGIRPIVFSNRLLFDLLLCLEAEGQGSDSRA
jgi:hypothetical protein